MRIIIGRGDGVDGGAVDLFVIRREGPRCQGGSERRNETLEGCVSLGAGDTEVLEFPPLGCPPGYPGGTGANDKVPDGRGRLEEARGEFLGGFT